MSETKAVVGADGSTDAVRVGFASFTPGPWAVHPRWPHKVVTTATADRPVGFSVDPAREAEQYTKAIADADATEHEDYRVSRVMFPEAKANARLIAAAPDLLAALEAMVEAFIVDADPGTQRLPVNKLATDAIAKARTPDPTAEQGEKNG